MFILLFCFSFFLKAQEEWRNSILGSYQVSKETGISLGYEYNLGKIYLGANFQSELVWQLRGLVLFADQSEENLYGIRCSLYWSTNWLGIGLDSRYLFQPNYLRADIGPSARVGYKYIWIEYSFTPHYFSDFDGEVYIETENNLSHNLNITLRYPIR